MKRLVITGAIVALAANICLPTLIQRREADTDIGQITEAVKKGEMTQKDAIQELTAMARKRRDLVEAALPTSPDAYSCVRVLDSLDGFNDKSTLPLFKEMSLSTCESIRRAGLSKYIKSLALGVADVLSFIEGLAKDSRYTEYDRYYAYNRLVFFVRGPYTYEEGIKMGGFLKVADHPPPKPPPEILEKVHRFMLEKTQTDNNEDIVKELDQLLAKQLSGYATSLQRAQTVEKFAETRNEYWRKHWQAAKDEIEKVPASERKDFRAKGELLDPERQPR